MRTTISDKLIAWMALLTGLCISAVAIYYSVAGLVSIFAAAAIPIIVMGVTLEISKLVATIWLKQNWFIAPRFIKYYLLLAITVLMLITSMGIFGYLSKAHTDQTLVSGDVQAKISLIDEKIKIERENIDNAQSVIKQMDAAVNGVISTGDQQIKLKDGSTRIQSSAERSLQIRRSQAKDRAALTKQIEEAQSRIVKLQEEAAPIRAEVRKVEAEVGPIKYIAALIYGDNPDVNLLERAVRWVIIIIVAVFDPLAVILLLASQYSFSWFRKQKEKDEQTETVISEIKTDELPLDKEVTQAERKEPALPENKPVVEAHPYLNQPFSHFTDLKPMVYKPEVVEEPKVVESVQLEGHDETEEDKILNSVSESEKKAMTQWKKEHPSNSLKFQRRLLDKGLIKELPWLKYLKPEADFVDENSQAAVEAARWAQEQLEKSDDSSKKKGNSLDGKAGKSTNSKDSGKVVYQQNAEQDDSTIWQRVKSKK